VNDETPSLPSDQYRCPGAGHSISRAVHLGRLAAFYPACRQCPRRDDTGTLSPRQVAQLADVVDRDPPRTLFHDEGAGGVYLNDLTPAAAKAIAAAFAAVLLEKGRGLGTSVPSEPFAAKPQAVCASDSPQIFKSPSLQISKSSILLAGDGRPLTAELVAAAAEGLRLTGRDVVDLGPSTSACLAFAVERLDAGGGVFIGNPGSGSHTVGMKFWGPGARPLSAGGSLEPIIEQHGQGIERTARKFGQLHRFQADGPYLAEMSKLYHALRPLRVVVDSASKPALNFLQRLAATVACEVIPSRSARNDLPQQVRGDGAHFAACIDGDGEACHVFDEQGREVSPNRLLLLLAISAGRFPVVGGDSSRRSARHLRQSATGVASYSQETAGTVVLESDVSPALVDRLQRLGIQIAMSSPRRADMAAAMLANDAMLGGGPSGRFWHGELGLPLCDAVLTVTHLMKALSHSDAPLSSLLDRHPLLS
jgi:phosphomannomutase